MHLPGLWRRKRPHQTDLQALRRMHRPQRLTIPQALTGGLTSHELPGSKQASLVCHYFGKFCLLAAPLPIKGSCKDAPFRFGGSYNRHKQPACNCWHMQGRHREGIAVKALLLSMHMLILGYLSLIKTIRVLQNLFANLLCIICRRPSCRWWHGLACLLARWLPRLDLQPASQGTGSLPAEAGHLL